jgi:hypothetical protein
MTLESDFLQVFLMASSSSSKPAALTTVLTENDHSLQFGPSNLMSIEKKGPSLAIAASKKTIPCSSYGTEQAEQATCSSFNTYRAEQTGRTELLTAARAYSHQRKTSRATRAEQILTSEKKRAEQRLLAAGQRPGAAANEFRQQQDVEAQ